MSEAMVILRDAEIQNTFSVHMEFSFPREGEE